jgi:hypothetical protein
MPYFNFCLLMQNHCRHSQRFFQPQEILKTLDEYNYCRVTKEWI